MWILLESVVVFVVSKSKGTSTEVSAEVVVSQDALGWKSFPSAN